MIKIEIKRVGTAYKVPALNFDRKTLKEFAKVAEASVLDNIMRGRVDKQNAQSTKDRKRLLGRNPSDVALVDEHHRFVQGSEGSWRHVIKESAQQAKVVPATVELRLLSAAVQRKGYTGFMVLGKTGEAALRAVVRGFLEAAFKKVGFK